MKLNILGSGTCIPYSRRGSSGYALSLNKSKILLDCGNGTTWKLEKIGINYLEIDHIFITHLHPDHNSDLIPFLFATKYPITRRTKPLKIWGPKGFKDFIELLYEAYKKCIQPEEVEILELDETDYNFEDYKLYCMKTPHTENSLAFKIESNGKTVVYTGDTDYTDSLIKFSKNCDLLLIECSLPDEFKAKGHLTPSEVLKISNSSNAKKTVLTHLYPICDNQSVFETMEKNSDNKIVLAEDLLEIEI